MEGKDKFICTLRKCDWATSGIEPLSSCFQSKKKHVSFSFHFTLDNLMVFSKYMHCFKYYLREYPLNSADIKIMFFIYPKEAKR